MRLNSLFVVISLICVSIFPSLVQFTHATETVNESTTTDDSILLTDQFNYSIDWDEVMSYGLVGESYTGCIGQSQIYCLKITDNTGESYRINFEVIKINEGNNQLISNVSVHYPDPTKRESLERSNIGFNIITTEANEFVNLIIPHAFGFSEGIYYNEKEIQGTSQDLIADNTNGMFRVMFDSFGEQMQIQQISSFSMIRLVDMYNVSTPAQISSRYSVLNDISFLESKIYIHSCSTNNCQYNASISSISEKGNNLSFLSLNSDFSTSLIFSIQSSGYYVTKIVPTKIYSTEDNSIVFTFGSGTYFRFESVNNYNHSFSNLNFSGPPLHCSQFCIMKVSSSLNVDWAFSMTPERVYYSTTESILAQNPKGDYLVYLDWGINGYGIHDLKQNLTTYFNPQSSLNNHCSSAFLLIKDDGSFGNAFCSDVGSGGDYQTMGVFDIIWKGDLLSIGVHSSAPEVHAHTPEESFDTICHVALYDTSDYNNVTLLNESGCLGHYVPGKKSVIGPQNETYEFSIYTNLTYNENEELVFYYVLEKDKPAVNFSQWLNYQPPIVDNENQTNNSNQNNSSGNNSNSNNSNTNNSNESGQNGLENNTNSNHTSNQSGSSGLENDSNNSSQDNDGLNNSSNNNEKPSEGAEGDETLFSSQLKVYLTIGLLMFFVYLLTTTIYSNRFDK